MLIRAERAAVNPAKDAEKARQILPFAQKLAALRARIDLTADQKQSLEEFRWLIEELKVSLFAQELGTSVPISSKRLDRFIEEKGLI